MCVLLTVLWVRSYFCEDGVCWGITDKSGFMGFSVRGMLVVDYIRNIGDEVNISKWFVASYRPGETFWFSREVLELATLGFHFGSYPNGAVLIVPHWALILMSGATAAVLIFKRSWQFSLRTLFMAVTLAAVALGGLIALARFQAVHSEDLNRR